MSGFLPPLSPPPADDAALDIALQNVVRGITGIDGKLIRPRWQETPPTQPAININWCAIGVTRETPDTYAAVFQQPTDAEQRVQQRQWRIEATASFYGPACGGYAKRLLNGLLVFQNVEVLRKTHNIAFVSAEDSAAVPEIVNGQWYRRVDVQLVFRRQVETTYSSPTVAAVPPIIIDHIP